ncbi:MAG: hypothetical protein Q8L64_04850 [bacterium]|nr:hypothetical protein [bacterium]
MIKYIVLGLIIILALSYFGYDLQSIVESPASEKNLGYVWGGISYVWNGYIKGPVAYFWNNIFINLLWNSFLHNLGKINSGAPTELEAAGQRLLHIGDSPYRPIAE